MPALAAGSRARPYLARGIVTRRGKDAAIGGSARQRRARSVPPDARDGLSARKQKSHVRAGSRKEHGRVDHLRAAGLML